MRNRTYGGVRGREMKVEGKLLHFPPTRLDVSHAEGNALSFGIDFRNFYLNMLV